MDRESQSARSTLQRQETTGRIDELERENKQLRETVIGLGALVAQAHAAGFVQARKA